MDRVLTINGTKSLPLIQISHPRSSGFEMTELIFTFPIFNKKQVRVNNITSRFLSGHYIFAGIVFLVPGIVGLFLQHYILSAIDLFISWFLFATHSGIEIDTEQRKFREYNSWFGIFKTGTWKILDKYLGVTLVSMNKVYRMYSQSNRVNSSTKKEFWVYLVDKAKKPAIPIKKCKTHVQAQTAMDELAIWLKMPVFSIKNSNSHKLFSPHLLL